MNNSILQFQRHHFPKGKMYLSGRSFFLLVLLLAMFGTAKADIVEIGMEGASTSNYIPAYNLYNYSLTQQIFTAEEIGVSGIISSISFLPQGSVTRTLDIYMVHTTKQMFSGSGDWITVTIADKVFSGSVSMNGDWTTIALDYPFEYNGTDNLVVVVNDRTGSWSSAVAYSTYTDQAMALYVYQDSGQYYPTSPSGYGGGMLNMKNRIQLDIASAGNTPPNIVTLPEVIDLGYRPNGYWTAPYSFWFYNLGISGTVTSVASSNLYFNVDAEVPYSLPRYGSMPVSIATGTTTAGEVLAQLEVQFERNEDVDTMYFDVTATAYDAVSPDVWELAETVTEFPFQATTTTANLYKNYVLSEDNQDGKDAVYKVSFDNDVLFNAGNNGANHITAIYTEDFNGVGGPSTTNKYQYTGPEVNPSPISIWYTYNYYNGNVNYGPSTNNGFYFGYKIPASKIESLGIADCSLTTVESMAYRSYPYDLYIIRGGDNPSNGTIICYQPMDYNPVAQAYFTINLDEPLLVGTEDLWVVFYSQSPYAAYCGKNPVDTENGKIWYCNPSAQTPTWYSYTAYTPIINCHFVEISTGRQIAMDLGGLEIKDNPTGVHSEISEVPAENMGASKAQAYNEKKAMYANGNRDVMTRTVYDGASTSDCVPVYGYFTDLYGRCQYVMPANVLEGMKDFMINQMDLYLSSSASVAWTGTFQVYMTEVDDTGISRFVNPSDATTVYTGTLDATGPLMTVTFDNPYTYNGGNLLIGFDEIVTGNYTGAVFYGETVNGACIQGVSSNSLEEAYPGQQNFLPKTTFYFEEDLPLDPNAPQYQIKYLYVPAGTYYVVTASTGEDFRVDMDITAVPTPEQALVIAPENEETNVGNYYLAEWVLGAYTKEVQVLLGTDYPPTTPIVDWTSELVEAAVLPELNHNRMYFLQVNERNDMGTTSGEIVSFTTPFDIPHNFETVTPYLFKGDTAVFTWNAIDDEKFLDYCFYNGIGTLPEEVAETTFSVANLDYNIYDGHSFYLMARYESGNSDLASAKVYVSGYGTVAGAVYEQDGVTPVKTGNILFEGKDEFGNDVQYAAPIGEDGTYNIVVKAGSYELTTQCEGYQNIAYVNNPLSVAYEAVVEGIDFILDEEFVPVSNVTVAYNPDEENPNSPYVKIDWTNGDRSFSHYRVYRTNSENEGPFSVYNTQLVAEVTEGNSIIDEAWENVETGLYKYGVSCVYEGNRDAAVANLTEGFDEGLPMGWTMIDADNDGRCWMLGSQAALGTGFGHNGSKDMMISKSYENNGAVYPDNYLVTPLVKFSAFSEFSFWACAQDANYALEHFGVSVSTNGNESARDFVLVYENTLGPTSTLDRNSRAQGQWYQYKVDLSQFAGQTGYVAIRHFNCNNNFYLDIDDVVLFDANAQLERESEIVWSNSIGKGMYLTDGAVSITAYLNSGDEPTGIQVTFKNVNEPEYEDIVVTLDDNGYYAFESIRKGDYQIHIEKDNYYSYDDVASIWEPVSLQYMIDEVLTEVENLQVTSSGYVTWDAENDRHFTGEYAVHVYSNDGWLVWESENITEHEIQIPEDLLSDRMEYEVDVLKIYTSGFFAGYKHFTYKSCDHFDGAESVYAKVLDEGVSMSWNYPVFDTTITVTGEWQYYDTGTNEGGMGYGSNQIYWGVLFPAGTYEGNSVSKIAIFDRVATDVTVTIYNGGDDAPSNPLSSMEVSLTGAWEYVEFEFPELVTIDPDENVWVVIYSSGGVGYPVPIGGPIENNSYYSPDGVNWFMHSRAFMLRAYFYGIVPEYHEIAGANIYHNGELVGFTEGKEYTLEGEEYGQWDDYGVEVLYEGHLHSCVQNAYMLSVFNVSVDSWTYHQSTTNTHWSHNDEGGYVLGLGEYYELDTCTLIAVPNEGFELFYWSNPYTTDYYTTDTITFVVDANHQLIEVDFRISEQYDEFVPGWNWWTSYLELNDNNGFEQLTNQLNTSGDMIVSQTAFTQSYGDYGWYGSLTDINNEEMYKVKIVSDSSVNVMMTGSFADAANHPITLNKGWNWIGYVHVYSDGVDHAFSGFTPTDGDMVKSQYAYANYYEGYGWYGSLYGLNPGEGLMYKSMNDSTVHFTYATYDKSKPKENLRGQHWSVNHNDYSNNMTVMAVVELKDEELKSDQYELAAFSNGVCRGSIELLYVEPINRYLAFLTISGEGDETLTFGLFDKTTGEERFDSETMLTFAPDAMIGGFEAPFVVSFRGTTGLNDLGASLRLYPNPVDKGEMIHINLAEKPVRVEILNAMGEILVMENKLQQPFSINAPTAPGVYTVRIVTESMGVVSHKIIVK